MGTSTAIGENACPDCGRKLASDVSPEDCPTCLLGLGLELEMVEEAEDASRRVLGNYELLDEVARGGMGIVFRARQLDLDRVVALKLLLAGEWASQEFVDRFRTEAFAAAALDHPAIVPIYDHGEDDGQWYIAMKFVEGCSLDQRIRKGGPIPPREAATLIARLARAIHFAHQHGVLHRDLKPANILLDEESNPYLTDFGLARLSDRTSQAALTRTIAVLGTPSYLPPEQATGSSRDVTTAADVYGLGGILYECLAGKPVFVGKNAADTVRMVAEEAAPALRNSNPTLGRELDTICATCLEKEPSRRYPSALALAEDLERWIRGEPIHVRPAGQLERTIKWIRRHPWPAAVAALIVVALATVAGVSLNYTLKLNEASKEISELADERQRELAVLQVTNGNREAAEGDLHAALHWYAAAADLDRDRPERTFAHQLRFSLAHRQSPQPIDEWTHEGGALISEFSPDGRWMVSGGADGRVVLVRPEDHSKKTIEVGKVTGALSFSPDGTLLAVKTRKGPVHLFETDSGEELMKPVPGNAVLTPRHGIPKPVPFLSDGSGFIVAYKNEARIYDLDGSIRRRIEFPNRISHASLSPDGTRLALAGRNHHLAIFDVQTGERLGANARRLAWGAIFWSPDGKYLLAASVGSFILIKFSVPDLKELTHASHREFTFLAQPDPRGERWLIFGYDEYARIADSDLRWLGPPMRKKGLINHAAWDPKYQRVVTAGANGVVQLWDATTGKALPGMIHHFGGAKHASFSADGSQLLTAGLDGRVRLWKLPPPDGAELKVPQGGPTQRADFSRDGSLVCSTSLSKDVRVWSTKTGQLVGPLLRHQSRPYICAWSGDDSEVLSVTLDGVLHRWKIDPDDPSPTMTKEISTLNIPDLTGRRYPFFTPDGGLVGAVMTNGTLRLFDTLTGKMRWEISNLRSTAEPEFPKDGKQAVWNYRHGLLVADTESGAILETIKLPNLEGKEVVAVSDDLDRFALVEKGLQVWISDREGNLVRAGRHLSTVFSAVFLYDGRVLATSSSDSTVRLWDTTTGEPLGAPLPHGNRTLYFNVSPDGTRLLTHSSESFIRVWDLSVDHWTPERMLEAAHQTTGHELGPDGELYSLDE